jgi:phage terminase small subunit
MTPRQEKFAIAVGAGMTLLDAAQHAGFADKSAQQRATKLVKLPAVAELIALERAKALEETRIKGNFDLTVAMEAYDQAIAFARETKNASALVKAIDSKARMVGLGVEKKDTNTGQFALVINGFPVQATVVRTIENE